MVVTPSLRPEDYGARGDGRTDDTAAFRAVFEALPTSGGVMELTSGSTYVLDTVDIGRLRKRITIVGPEATIRKSATTVDHLFRDTVGGADGLRVQGVTFDLGRDAFTPGETVSAFFFVRTRDLRFVECTFRSGIEEGLKFYKCQDVVVERCLFEDIRNNGVQFNSPVSDGFTGRRNNQGTSRVAVRHSRFVRIDDGLHGSLDGQAVSFGGNDPEVTTQDCELSFNRAEDCVRGFWAEFNTSGHAARGFRFDHNEVREAESHGIGVVGVQDFELNGNRAYNIGRRSSASADLAAFVISGSDAPRSRDGVLTGNVAVDDRGGSAAMEHGFLFRQCQGVTALGGNHSSGATESDWEIEPTCTESEISPG